MAEEDKEARRRAASLAVKAKKLKAGKVLKTATITRDQGVRFINALEDILESPATLTRHGSSPVGANYEIILQAFDQSGIANELPKAKADSIRRGILESFPEGTALLRQVSPESVSLLLESPEEFKDIRKPTRLGGFGLAEEALDELKLGAKRGATGVYPGVTPTATASLGRRSAKLGAAGIRKLIGAGLFTAPLAGLAQDIIFEPRAAYGSESPQGVENRLRREAAAQALARQKALEQTESPGLLESILGTQQQIPTMGAF